MFTERASGGAHRPGTFSPEVGGHLGSCWAPRACCHGRLVAPAEPPASGLHHPTAAAAGAMPCPCRPPPLQDLHRTKAALGRPGRLTAGLSLYRAVLASATKWDIPATYRRARRLQPSSAGGRRGGVE